jgi:hypothetical protein
MSLALSNDSSSAGEVQGSTAVEKKRKVKKL